MWINSKFDQHCKECGDPIEAGERIVYDIRERKTYCSACGIDLEDDDPQLVSDVASVLQLRALQALNNRR